MRLILIAAAALTLATYAHAGQTVTFTEMTPPVRSLADAEGYEWTSVNTTHCRIYFQQDTYAAQHLESVKAECELGITKSLKFLGEDAYTRGVRVFVVETRDELVPFIGARYKAYALMGDDAIVMAHNAGVRMYAVHEIFHVVSEQVWGEPVPWLREGAAVYADGVCLDLEQPFHAVAAYLKANDMLFTMRSLATDFNAAFAESDLRAYLQSASFVQYLYENYGRDAVEKHWRSRAVDTTDAFGKNLEALEGEWLEFLDGVDHSHIDWDRLDELGCG